MPRRVKRLHERLAISAGQRIEQGLVDLKVEHHVHAIAGVTKIFHVGSRKHVGLRQDDCVALPPLQKLTKAAQHVILLDWSSYVHSLGRDDERDRVHAKARDPELDPKAHDLQDLGLDLRVGSVEVGLKIVESVKIPGLGLAIVAPG